MVIERRLPQATQIETNGNGTNGHHLHNGIVAVEYHINGNGLVQEADEIQPQLELSPYTPLAALDSTIAALQEQYTDRPDYKRLLSAGRTALLRSARHYERSLSSLKIEDVTAADKARYGAMIFGSTIVHSANKDLALGVLQSLGVSLDQRDTENKEENSVMLDEAYAGLHIFGDLPINSWNRLFLSNRFPNRSPDANPQTHFKTQIPGIIVSLDYTHLPFSTGITDSDGNEFESGLLIHAHLSPEGAATLLENPPLREVAVDNH